MNSNFRVPNMGIKQISPITEQRQIGNLRREANPMGGPLAIPKPIPTQLHTAPNQFEKLRMLLSPKK